MPLSQSSERPSSPKYNGPVLGGYISAFFLLLPVASAQPATADVRAILANIIGNRHESAGIVVGMIDPRGSRIVSYDDHAQRMDGSTIFEIGSLTKIFTALLLTDMAERGEVELSDPVAKYLPSSVHIPERAGRSITLQDLATNTSGLPRSPANFTPHYSLTELFNFLSSYQLTRDIGSEWEYSNFGYALLGQALALRAGTSFESLVRSRITEPLAIDSTRIVLLPADHARLTPGHNKQLAQVEASDFGALAPAAGLHSTANDLVKLLAPASPVSSAMAAMLSVRRPTTQPGLVNALGWQISTPDALEIVWKDGNTPGYSSFMGFNPRTKTGVVVLSNTSTTAVTNRIGMHLLDPTSALFPIK